MASHGAIRSRWYLAPSIIIVLGILATTMLALTNRIGVRQYRHFILHDAVLSIQLRAATFHLWCEEAITGDENVDMKKLWLDIDRAIYLSEVLLKGGVYEIGLILEPLKNPERRTQAEGLKVLLTRFKALARQRFDNPGAALIGSILDQNFDAVYKEIEDKTRALDNAFKENQTADQAKVKRLFWGILISWMVIVSVVTIGLWIGEVRRKHAEEALERAKDGLEIKVTERTKELRNVNDQLQLELNERRKVQEELRESEQQLRYLSSQLLTAQEKERRNIAREIHDSIGQSLATLTFGAGNVLDQLRKRDYGNAEAKLENVVSMVRNTIDEVRRIQMDLRPPMLDDIGIGATINWFCREFQKVYSTIHIEKRVEIEENQVLDLLKVTLYRIIQEAFSNISRHSKGDHVVLSLETNDNGIALKIWDNGQGFDPEEARKGDLKGMGLSSMKERADLSGGTFSVLSEKGKGTTLSFTWSLQQ